MSPRSISIFTFFWEEYHWFRAIFERIQIKTTSLKCERPNWQCTLSLPSTNVCGCMRIFFHETFIESVSQWNYRIPAGLLFCQVSASGAFCVLSMPKHNQTAAQSRCYNNSGQTLGHNGTPDFGTILWEFLDVAEPIPRNKNRLRCILGPRNFDSHFDVALYHFQDFGNSFQKSS